MNSHTRSVKADQQRQPRSVVRMVGLETSVKMLGTQQLLADALGIDARSLRAKLTAERGVSNADLFAAAVALEGRAAQIVAHAAKLRAEATA